MDVIMGKPSNYLFWFPPYHVWLPKGSKVIFQLPLSFLWSLCAVSGREKLDVAATSQLDTLYWPTSRSLTMVVPIMPVYPCIELCMIKLATTRSTEDCYIQYVLHHLCDLNIPWWLCISSSLSGSHAKWSACSVQGSELRSSISQ